MVEEVNERALRRKSLEAVVTHIEEETARGHMANKRGDAIGARRHFLTAVEMWAPHVSSSGSGDEGEQQAYTHYSAARLSAANMAVKLGEYKVAESEYLTLLSDDQLPSNMRTKARVRLTRLRRCTRRQRR